MHPRFLRALLPRLLLLLGAAHASERPWLRPLQLRGGASGMTYPQGVLAFTGSVVTLSGVVTVLDPKWTRAHGVAPGQKAPAESTHDRMLTNLLGLAMLGWGVGKLCVRRGYERAFMQLNTLPMLGALAVAGQRLGPTAFWFQAVSAVAYALIGFMPRARDSHANLFNYLPDRRVYRA
ncbi:hypothetical protein AB1Y20_016796 [Prymnesium parvum]|uniref:Uncharacterized protein n=1 Tax=Prymnesium parvum TaxID=97485 RepID=A0AB34IC38_PRYPA